MIYRTSVGSLWDPSVVYHYGVFYAAMMHNPDGPRGLDASQGFMAVSDDGVHWRDGWPLMREREADANAIFYKAFFRRLGDRFILNHGVLRDSKRQDTLRFYESKDLHEWQYLGSTHPDSRWYESDGRWDHMYMLPKAENDPEAGYWGYVVATPKAGLTAGCGMMESADGRHWKVLPPPQIEWGTLTPRNLEIGGCERIGGKYVLIGGYDRFLGDGYCMYALMADEPAGPFRPQLESFRLCGTSTRAAGWGVSFLAAWCNGTTSERLISNYASTPAGTWMLPLREARMEDGHLRLGWWAANERLRGDAIALDDASDRVGVDGRPRECRWLVSGFDLNRGLILEGTMRAEAQGEAREPAIGFVFEELDGQLLETRLMLDRHAEGVVRIGKYHPVTDFREEDLTAGGCATICKLKPLQPSTFRLLVRRDLFELYVDDRLVQTYVFRARDRGRVGLLACEAASEWGNLMAHTLSVG